MQTLELDLVEKPINLELSTYQEAILKHVKRSRELKENKKKNNFSVSAVAGSGKSFTNVLVIELIKKEWPSATVLCLQHNKHIKEELDAKLTRKGVNMKGVEVSTSHSAGLRVLRDNRMGPRGRVNTSKYYKLSQEIIDKNKNIILPFLRKDGKADPIKDRKLLFTAVSQLTEIVKMAMNTLNHDSAITELEFMCEKHEITYSDKILIEYVDPVIKGGIKGCKVGDVSFEDMICMPVMLGLKFPEYDFVLCDEQQDFNAAQLCLAEGFKGKNGIIGAFGDSLQSIMAFAGAMTDSVPQFISKFKAKQLELSICYRCPSTVLDLARLLVPHILDRPGCPEGSVLPVQPSEIETLAKAGDYILCRTTAPLVAQCIKFIRKRTPAKVKGRDIGSRLIKMYEEFVDLADRKPNHVDEFIGLFKDYVESERARAVLKGSSQSKISSMNDSFDAILAVAEYLSEEAKMTKGFIHHTQIKTEIEKLFADDADSSYIILSTVHKAKGLECDNVFIIDYHNMPFVFPGKELSPEGLQQERNIKYVALTRAKQKLYICGKDISNHEDIVRQTKK